MKFLNRFLKTMRRLIREVLTDVDDSHKEFTLVSNETENYRKLKENIRIKNSQKSDIEKDVLIKHGKVIGID